MINAAALQHYLPASFKNALKPYYRTFFPNQLCVVLMITFRCNYSCSYCAWVTAFAYSDIYSKKDEPTTEAWLHALNKLSKANIYIQGGEPFLYDGLPELINGLGKHKMLGIATNISVKTDAYARITKKTHLNLSFHRECTSEEQFLDKIDELRKIGKFHLNVNLVATRENLPVIPRFEKILAGRGVSLHIDPFVDPDAEFKYTPEERALLSRYLAFDRHTNLNMLDFHSRAPKECSAGKNYICIMPDGAVFRCVGGGEYFHSPLKKRLLSTVPGTKYHPDFFFMGSIFDPGFKLDKTPVLCNFPCTSACDRDMATIKWLNK